MRLYYNDSYLFEFDARIIQALETSGKHAVILDQTAFYPTSGGQPNDLGSLGGIRVLDVYEDETSGEVVHVVERPISPGPIHGSIDASRRRDHIQQHSGQHVLSRAFVELFGFETVGFHMGEVASTIDLTTELLTPSQLSDAEDAANAAVLENRPVQVCYIPPESVADAGLRKPTEREGEIRVIDIDGFDRSACGGTHVRMTGEIGPILIVGTERVRKQVRVHFVCGVRAIRHARVTNRALESIGQTLSVSPFDSVRAVRDLWEGHLAARKRQEELEAMLLDYEAAALEPESGLVLRAFKNRGIETIKLLASKICARPGKVALLADESDQLRVVFARSSDISLDAAALLKQVIGRFGGRGGGRPNLAQAGGLQASSPMEVLEFAKVSATSGGHLHSD
jgi:alanyl-tRNA synthetase